jgi:hypothetical protein
MVAPDGCIMLPPSGPIFCTTSGDPPPPPPPSSPPPPPPPPLQPIKTANVTRIINNEIDPSTLFLNFISKDPIHNPPFMIQFFMDQFLEIMKPLYFQHDLDEYLFRFNRYGTIVAGNGYFSIIIKELACI